MEGVPNQRQHDLWQVEHAGSSVCLHRREAGTEGGLEMAETTLAEWARQMDDLRDIEHLAQIEKLIASRCSEGDRAKALLARHELEKRMRLRREAR